MYFYYYYYLLLLLLLLLLLPYYVSSTSRIDVLYFASIVLHFCQSALEQFIIIIIIIKEMYISLFIKKWIKK